MIFLTYDIPPIELILYLTLMIGMVITAFYVTRK